MAEATVKIKVVKGSTSLGIAKGKIVTATFEEADGHGVKVGNLGPSILWMAGSRKYLPTFTKGATFNLNTGDPTRAIKVEVL